MFRWFWSNELRFHSSISVARDREGFAYLLCFATCQICSKLRTLTSTVEHERLVDFIEELLAQLLIAVAM